MNLIVLKFLAALEIKQGRAVVGGEPAVWTGFPAHHAEQEIAFGIARNLLRTTGEIRLAERKRCGNFGPDDEPGILLPRRDADAIELRHVPGMNSIPIGRVLHRLWQVRLHQMGDLRSVSCGDKSGTYERGGKDERAEGGQYGDRKAPWPLAAQADEGADQPDYGRVICGHNKG